MGNANGVQERGEYSMQEEGGDGKQVGEIFVGDSSPPVPQEEPSSPPVPQVETEARALFYRQTPMAPLLQSDEMHIQNLPSVQHACDYSSSHRKVIPTLIVWSWGGMSVAVAGSWDNWKSITPLYWEGKDFVVMKVLPAGFYQYKFMVDGYWRHAPDLPWMCDENGRACNFLDLQDYLPDNVQSIADFETSNSSDSSISSYSDEEFLEDYSKAPPAVPPQLITRSYIENDMSTFSKPEHVVLNHLYVEKPRSNPNVVAVGETSRFESKYVTVVLYKSVQGQ